MATFTLPPATATNSTKPTFKNIGEFLSYLQVQGTNFGISLGWCLLVAFIGYILIKIVVFILKKILIHRKLDKTVVVFSISVTDVMLRLFLTIICIGILGIEAVSVAAIMAALAFAIGLSLSGLLQNFVAGAYLIVSRPISLDNFVSVTGGVEGTVIDIGVVNTTILTPDRRQVIIPNSKLAQDNIINYDKEKIRRCDREVRVPLHEDINFVRKVILRICKKDPRVVKDPEPRVRVMALDRDCSSVVLSARAFVPKEFYWELWFDLPELIKLEFDRCGIRIQVPQREVFLHQPEEFPEKPPIDEKYRLELEEAIKKEANEEEPVDKTPWAEWTRLKQLEALKGKISRKKFWAWYWKNEQQESGKKQVPLPETHLVEEDSELSSSNHHRRKKRHNSKSTSLETIILQPPASK